MKKLFILTVALGLGAAVSSCKKDYTCKCTKTYTSSNTTVSSTVATYTYKDTKTTAESRCNANETTGSDIGGNYSINCDIQ